MDPSFSVQELSAKFYNEKRNFINENKPRFRQVIEFITENNKAKFADEPNYSALKAIFGDLFKGVREDERDR